MKKSLGCLMSQADVPFVVISHGHFPVFLVEAGGLAFILFKPKKDFEMRF